VDIVQRRNPLAKIKITQNGMKDEMKGDAKRALVLKGLRTLIDLNKSFKLRLDRLKLPLIFSIMALLSNDKVNLFDD